MNDNTPRDLRQHGYTPPPPYGFIFIFENTCSSAIHDAHSSSTSTPCRRGAPLMHHSLAKSQASGMHVALDHLPAPGLAAPRHHASNAVAATGPRPIPRARAAPAVARRGSGATLPTLFHGPAGQKWRGGRQGKHERTRREDQERIGRRERDRQTHGRTVQSRRAKVLSVKLVSETLTDTVQVHHTVSK